MLAPDLVFDLTSKHQHQIIDDFFMLKKGTSDVPSDIRITEFNHKMKNLYMDMSNPDAFDRLRKYLGDITELQERTRVDKVPKKFIQAIQKGVYPLRLRNRLAGLMVAGTSDQKAAYGNLQVYKSLLRSESKKDAEAFKLLKQSSLGQRDPTNRNRRDRTMKRFGGHIKRFQQNNL